LARAVRALWPPAAEFESPASLGLLAGAGFLVGLGTRIGGGCTSGHGICGVAQLSLRSVVATGVFMALGMAAVYVARHVVGGAG
jgi:uncharacterized membrane protein YedE/YeeE